MGFYIIGGIAFIASMLIQWRLKAAYSAWGKVANSKNMTEPSSLLEGSKGMSSPRPKSSNSLAWVSAPAVSLP